MPDPALAVPDAITFEQAIALTQTLLDRLDQQGLAESDLEATIAQLVRSTNGARGFFVTYLSDDRAIADQPSSAVVQALASSPETVSELLVKNLAMSSAMAITHRHNQNEALAQGSDRVKARTARLIRSLQQPEITAKAQQMRESAATGTGFYQDFLNRWGYNPEQRQEIQTVMEQILASPS